MNGKNNRKNEKKHIKTRKKNLMIASYRQKYSEKSLDKLKRIIKDETPEKIMIIKFIEEKKLPRLIDGSMGFREKKKFIEFLRKEKKEKAYRFTKELIEMIEEFEIPYEIHLRRSDDLASTIIKEFVNMSIDHVILHTPKKVL